MREIPSSLLQEITRRLVQEFKPEQVVMFGSHAWGVPNEDSDLDLLVVVSHSDTSPALRAVQAHRCLQGLSVPKDVLVRTREEVERYRGIVASLEHRIYADGRVLYEREAGTGAELVHESPA